MNKSCSLQNMLKQKFEPRKMNQIFEIVVDFSFFLIIPGDLSTIGSCRCAFTYRRAAVVRKVFFFFSKIRFYFQQEILSSPIIFFLYVSQ